MAMFDSSQIVMYRGTVTKFSYTNPHVYVYADVQKDGKTVNYRVEGSSPFALKEQGWSAKSLQVGETITIVAHPSKDNGNFGMLLSITKANGRTLQSGAQETGDVPQ